MSFFRDLFSSHRRAPTLNLSALERRLTQLLRTRSLPPELAVTPPRPDVWGTTGKLRLEKDRSRFKPLLLDGFATVGVVYAYESSGDADERTTHASYAWLDQNGRIQTQELHEEYDPHVGWDPAHDTGVVDIDVGLALDKPVIIVQDPRSGFHVIYEYLRVNPRWREELGTFCLRWEPGASRSRARVSHSPGDAPLFTVEREEGPAGGWRLLHEGQVHLRSTAGPPLDQGGLRHLMDVQGKELGRITAKGLGLGITLPPKTFSLTQEPNRLWLIRDQDGARVLGIWPDDRDPCLWHLVAHTRLERPLGELLVLAFLAGYPGVAPSP